MTAWKRWQDYATMVFGVLLIISPFVFGPTLPFYPHNLHRLSSISAYVLGALLVLSGIVAAATREARRSLIVNAPGIAAVVTFIAAIVLGFVEGEGGPVSQLRAEIAVTAGVMAIATVLVGATLRRREMKKRYWIGFLIPLIAVAVLVGLDQPPVGFGLYQCIGGVKLGLGGCPAYTPTGRPPNQASGPRP